MPLVLSLRGRVRSFFVPRLTLQDTGDPEVDWRLAAVGVAAVLGWISISAVLLGLATGLPVSNREIVTVTREAPAPELNIAPPAS